MPTPPPLASSTDQTIRAPRGTALSCQGWPQEAALRLLMNSLDPDVAEDPKNLTVCCGRSQAARDWESFHAIISALKNLADDQTLLIQSGQPTEVETTEPCAPRVVATDAFEPIAASWTFAGAQTNLPGAYDVLAALAQKHFGGSLAGKLVASGGLGGFGGAVPLAATLNGAAFLGIDADPERIKRRVKSGLCDVMVNDLDEALRILKNAVRKREAHSVGLVGNCADLLPALARRGVVPDLLTDQTPVDDPLSYLAQDFTVVQAAELRRTNENDYRSHTLASIAAHLDGLLALQKLRSFVFNSGNGISALARQQNAGAEIPILTPENLSDGRSLLRWVALSGEAADIYRLDQLALETFAPDESLKNWLALARKRVRFQGLPARICRLGSGKQAQFAVAINNLVSRGELKAPIVIVRDSTLTPPSAPATAQSLRDRTALADGATWLALSESTRQITRAFVADGATEMSTRLERAFGAGSI